MGIHDLRNRIRSLAGEDVARCVQCGKCSAGCPLAPDMTELPNQVMRFIQLNMEERALTSSMAWVCASCRTCSVRCPERIDVAAVMGTLRKLCTAGGYAPKERHIDLFNRLFVDSIAAFGRVHELGLVLRYNMVTRRPFQDLGLLPSILRKGKLRIMPQKIRGAAAVRDLIRKSRTFIRG